MEEKEKIDQSELAESVAKSIPYEFLDYFLIKPLDTIKVKKEFSKPVEAVPHKDKNGVEAQDFDKVETEVKEVDSDYRKAVIIKRPISYVKQLTDPEQSKYIAEEIKVGDVVIIRDTSGLRFDLLKDSRLVRTYDILGFER